MKRELDNFFYPESICIAGSSTKEKSIGYELLKTIKNFGFKGKLFPVNPKADDVLGYRCYKSVLDISDKIDLAIVVVPKQFVEETVDQLLVKGVMSIILITAGFKEIGETGEALEKVILNKIKSADAQLVGPNCMGVINALPEVNLNATFVAEKPETGSMAFLSQSGALGAAVLNSLRETDIKFAHFISVGNKADLTENDFLNYWETDPNIKTAVFYLESFENGFEFLKPFMLNRVTKPVIVLKAGRTESGMKAASSHTGALSSEDKIVDSLLKQFGIIRAENLNEMFNTAKGFESFPIPKGNCVAVITNAGGPAILAVDKIENKGLKLANLSESTKSKLRDIVHPDGSINNPIDLLPGGSADNYKKVNEIVVEDENVDAVISIFVEPVMVNPLPVVESVFSVKNSKPILQVIMPLPEFWSKYRNESKYKLPLFKNPEDAPEVLSNMLFYENSKVKRSNQIDEFELLLERRGKNIFSESPGFVSQTTIKEILKQYKLPLMKELLIEPNEIESLEIDFYPVVLKGISGDVLHKSELDAVILNIKSKEELFYASKKITDGFVENNFRLDQFLIQPFIQVKHEILLGGFRDRSFGPVIMFGSGGKYVEVYNDTSVKSAFLSDSDIDEMIESTSIGKILKGVRGETPVDLNKLKEIIKSAALMLIENEKIVEFDFNPLIVDHKNQIHPVDVRIKFEG